MGKGATAYTRKPLDHREARIIRRMKTVLKAPVTKIATVVERNKSSVYEALSSDFKPKKRGSPNKLSKGDISRLVRTIKALCKTARARWEVTMAMAMKKAKVKAGEGTIRKELHKRGIRFRRMRSKPNLTKEDITARKAFATKYHLKPRTWWLDQLDLSHDVENFPVYMSSWSRDLAAQREVRGAYREAGQGLDEAYVVIPEHLRWNSYAKSVRIAGGVGEGRVRLWEEIKGTWNGKKAAELYSGPILAALKRANQKKKKFLLLEDNDPTGYKSNKAIAAKSANKIEVFEIAKRSPDLSVMDYAIWKQVNRNMRAQEKRWPEKKRETRTAYITRLRRAAQN